jgi:ketol-acid reductoisomerase
MDYMYNACSTTARRGALDWWKKFRDANKPVFEDLYRSVKDGSETRRSLEFNNRKTYREDFAKETAEIDAQEIWRAGKTVRALRVSRTDMFLDGEWLGSLTFMSWVAIPARLKRADLRFSQTAHI